MVVTYYIKIFRTGADRRNGILMSLLLLVLDIKTFYIHTKLQINKASKSKIISHFLFLINKEKGFLY